MTVTLNFGGNKGKEKILTPYLDSIISLIRPHLNEANETEIPEEPIPEIIGIILTAYCFKSLIDKSKKNFYGKIVEGSIKKKAHRR